MPESEARAPAWTYPLGLLRVLGAHALATTGNLIGCDGRRLYCPFCRKPAGMLQSVRVPHLWAVA